MDWGRIALNRRFKVQPLPFGHNRNAMAAQIATEQNRITGANAGGANVVGVFNHAYAAGIDKNTIAFAPIHNFGISGDDAHASPPGRPLHGLDDIPEGFHRQPFFEDEPDAEVEGPRSAHGEIINGAMDGEGADITAGKKQGLDHVGIGGEGDAARGHGQGNGIMVGGVLPGDGEGGGKHFGNELLHQLAAAPVGEENGGVLLDGDGTGEVGSGHEVLENGNYVEDSERREGVRFSWGEWASPRAI